MNIFQDVKDIKKQLSILIRNNDNDKKYINSDIESSRKNIDNTNTKIDDMKEEMKQQNEIIQ